MILYDYDSKEQSLLRKGRGDAAAAQVGSGFNVLESCGSGYCRRGVIVACVTAVKKDRKSSMLRP